MNISLCVKLSSTSSDCLRSTYLKVKLSLTYVCSNIRDFKYIKPYLFSSLTFIYKYKLIHS